MTTMSRPAESQIRSLIRLLSDDDDKIVRTIGAKLVEIGEPAVPYLQEIELEQPEMARRIERILDEIRGSRLELELRGLAEQGGDELDLEQGVFLLARYAYPALDVTTYVRQLDAMASELRDRMGSRVSGEETVKTVGRYLFAELGYRGNTKDYYEPDNSFLNRVIERRTGIPISLSVLYLLVGRRLTLPVFGIGMPGHFLVKYESDKYKIFVDCFNAGALLTQKDCVRFLTQAGYGFEDKFLDRSVPRAILIRTIKNLVAIYQKLDESVKEQRLSRFLGILGADTPQSC
jgi:regulator of sirC expression with transglutaminase-like and TPR domain